MTRDEIRDQLGTGHSFMLVDEFDEYFDGTRMPSSWVSICVQEVEHHFYPIYRDDENWSRTKRKTLGGE